MAAFRLAADQGAAGVELDVRRTADGELVIYHDPVIPGLGPIVDAGLAAVRAVAPAVPTFAEAMAACAGFLANVEIKNSPGEPDHDPADAVAAMVAAWVAEADAYDRVLVSSFNPATGAAVRAADPGIPTGLLMAAGSLGKGVDAEGGVALAAAAGHRAFHPSVAQLAGDAAARVVAAARAAGLAVVVWTVDDPTEIRRLADAGVNGIITNDPAGARRALG